MASNLKSSHWMKDANCADIINSGNNVFASFLPEDVVQAKKICGGCTVQVECVMSAMDSIFVSAGMTKMERLKLQWKRVDDEQESNFGSSDNVVRIAVRGSRQALHSRSLQGRTNSDEPG